MPRKYKPHKRGVYSKDFKLAVVKEALKHGISPVSRLYNLRYQTVRSWVKRYEEGGEDALESKRIIPKPRTIDPKVKEMIIEIKRQKPNLSCGAIEKLMRMMGYKVSKKGVWLTLSAAGLMGTKGRKYQKRHKSF